MSEKEDKTFVSTRHGQVHGMDMGNVILFNGIPYAKPPVGELRWAAPQPPESWDGIREARELPPQSAQNRYLGVFSKPGGQEDCLYLNVWMPKNPDTSNGPLPVLVWIHGGALWCGFSGDHNGEKLAVQGNAIVVTINYRLGILGIFAHPALAKSGKPYGNFGLMDQQAALRWVKANIAAFGGDADNVTIFGESSGGVSAMAHLVSPRSKELFDHSIAMSGGSSITRYPHFGGQLTLKEATEKGVAFADAAGCDGSLDGLRALSLDTIMAEQTPFLAQQFIIDGHTLVEYNGDAIKAGRLNGKTHTSGSNRDEWTWAAGFTENDTGEIMGPAAYEGAMMFMYGEENGPKVLDAFPLSDFLSPSEAFSRAVTQSLFAAPMHWIAREVSRHMPVYAYEFADQTSPSYLLEPTTFALGAAHTHELSYFFPGYHGGEGIPTKLNRMQEKLSDVMVSLFARTGEATGERETEWPRYDPTKENYLTFVLPEPRQPQERFSKVHRTDFWDALGLW